MAITGGNGSHLSHLDIWEDLWLHRREGQAEVREARVLHRGLWHGSDDTPSLQQWEVKGKNKLCSEKGVDVAQQGRPVDCPFKRAVLATRLSNTHPPGHLWDSVAWIHTHPAGRERAQGCFVWAYCILKTQWPSFVHIVGICNASQCIATP